MRVFTVHVRIGGYDPDSDVVLVKEGFCWPAFFFGPLWALWHRMWLVAGVLFAVQAAVAALIEAMAVGGNGEAVLGLALTTIVGSVANDIRRWSLERCDFTLNAVVVGDNTETALHRFLASDATFAASVQP